MAFNHSLKSMREAAEISLTDMSRYLGFKHPASLQAIESGRQKVPADLPGRLQRFLALQEDRAREMARVLDGGRLHCELYWYPEVEELMYFLGKEDAAYFADSGTLTQHGGGVGLPFSYVWCLFNLAATFWEFNHKCIKLRLENARARANWAEGETR